MAIGAWDRLLVEGVLFGGSTIDKFPEYKANCEDVYYLKMSYIILENLLVVSA